MSRCAALLTGIFLLTGSLVHAHAEDDPDRPTPSQAYIDMVGSLSA
ncbi:MAG: hypothetical protein H6826_14995, partial [Planctomycetes bacterium]|nr:hypothetical protein [Planctomycetota bacterium]